MKYAVFLVLVICWSCKKPYEPPTLKNTPDFLVVDGFLTSSPDSTYIRLSHTRSIRDTAPSLPELSSTVAIEGDLGSQFFLTDAGMGLYRGILHLNPSEKYRLSVNTEGGEEYRSDFVPFNITPPIDRLSWEEDTSGVNFFLDTHDPQNATRYYRWQMEETWQYNTYLNTNFDYVNDSVVRRLPEQQIHNCWSSNFAGTIFLASTNNLSEDIISHFKFNRVDKTSEKISAEYSVQMKQFALTQDQYEYWRLQKKNSEQMGTVFDSQPVDLVSNIHCISNPSKPVMGYFCASTIERKRIFVTNRQLETYLYVPYYIPCKVLKDVTYVIPHGDKNAYWYLEAPRHLYTFWFDDGVYHIAQNFCIDCREHGGTNVKPDYWP